MYDRLYLYICIQVDRVNSRMFYLVRFEIRIMVRMVRMGKIGKGREVGCWGCCFFRAVLIDACFSCRVILLGLGYQEHRHLLSFYWVTFFCVGGLWQCSRYAISTYPASRLRLMAHFRTHPDNSPSNIYQNNNTKTNIHIPTP